MRVCDVASCARHFPVFFEAMFLGLIFFSLKRLSEEKLVVAVTEE